MTVGVESLSDRHCSRPDLYVISVLSDHLPGHMFPLRGSGLSLINVYEGPNVTDAASVFGRPNPRTRICLWQHLSTANSTRVQGVSRQASVRFFGPKPSRRSEILPGGSWKRPSCSVPAPTRRSLKGRNLIPSTLKWNLSSPLSRHLWQLIEAWIRGLMGGGGAVVGQSEDKVSMATACPFSPWACGIRKLSFAETFSVHCALTRINACWHLTPDPGEQVGDFRPWSPRR